MGNLEVVVHMKIRPGQLEGAKAQAAEILRLSRESDTHTLRCDWFVNADGTECDVHEMFPNEQGLIEHKMNTMAPTEVLFRGYAYDHQAIIFGEVSSGFVQLVTERMGPPTVFSFLQGLEEPGVFGHLEVIAHMKIRPAQQEAFEAEVAEILRLTRENDTQTLRYDWFIDKDETECEVHEAYRSERGLIEHNAHVMAARELLFRQYAFDHRMSVYGEISPQLRDLFMQHAGGVTEFVFLQGLEEPAAV
ncbi:MAG TPA: antibiotic biosynthesis monooxygenase [Acidimicrobiales bacterium]|jgi:quinol monooxygenase YgiN